MKFRQILLKVSLLRKLASVKLTTFCLCFLYILTFWGTMAQMQEGLYQVQNKFFYSFYFLAFGFIPFPGAQAVMWVLFINLLCVALVRFVYSWKNIGLIIIHCGLLLFLISGYITFKGSQESFLSLKENQASNVSTAYHDWEISVWEQTPQKDPLLFSHDIIAVDFKDLKPNQVINLKNFDMQLTVKEFCQNCVAYRENSPGSILNSSGITRLEPADLLKEPERNNPGGIFKIRMNNQDEFDVLLYADDKMPLSFKTKDKSYNMILRLRRYPLPFTLKLLDFKMSRHPGTDTPRSFQSLVEIQMEGAKREKLISMNIPLRYSDLTFYQSSYSIDEAGEETSVLAVVRNKGRIMPYIATFLTFLGLVVHFITNAIRKRKTKT